jgi:hypothetical protein
MSWEATLVKSVESGDGLIFLEFSITDGVETIVKTLMYRIDDPIFTPDKVQTDLANIAKGFGKIAVLKNKVGKVFSTDKGLKGDKT